MTKLISSLVAGAVVVAALVVATPAYADHSWGNYHWARTANPFTLKMGDAVTSAWDAYLVEARNDWNPSTVLDTTIVPSSINPKTCRATAGRIEVCNSKYGNNGWLGIASIWADSSGHITKGTAKMNDTYFTTASYNAPAWRRLVMCQEIAHVFGLDHQDEGFDNVNLGTCMDYTNDPDGGTGGASATDPSNEHPNAHDFAQLESMYAHADGYTTLAASVARVAGFARGLVYEDVSADSDELGTPVGYDESGRANRFERAERGGKKITHVFWLPEHEDGEEHGR